MPWISAAEFPEDDNIPRRVVRPAEILAVNFRRIISKQACEFPVPPRRRRRRRRLLSTLIDHLAALPRQRVLAGLRRKVCASGTEPARTLVDLRESDPGGGRLTSESLSVLLLIASYIV